MLGVKSGENHDKSAHQASRRESFDWLARGIAIPGLKSVTISSWTLDAALKTNVAVIDNRAVNVACYSPAYTFGERLQTISTKFRMQQESKAFPKNFMRHYYDVYCLLDSPDVRGFIGTPACRARKIERFRSGDNLDIASNEAFLLSDPKVCRLYETQYRDTEALYYAGQIPFSKILARIQLHIGRL